MKDDEKLIKAHKILLNEWESGKPVKPLYVYALDPYYLSDDVCKIIEENKEDIAEWVRQRVNIDNKTLPIVLYVVRKFFERGRGDNYWACAGLGNISSIIEVCGNQLLDDTLLKDMGIHNEQLKRNDNDYYDWFLYNCPFLSTEEAGETASRLRNNRKVKVDPIIQEFLSNLDWTELCDLHDNHPCQLQQRFSDVAEEFIEENVANDAQYPDSLDRLGFEKAYIHALLKYAPLEYLLSLKALITGGNKDGDEYRACVRIWPWLERLWGIAPSENDIGYVWHLHPGDNGTFYPCIQIKGLERIVLEQNDKEISCNTNDPSLALLKKKPEINCEDDFNIVVPERGNDGFRVAVHNPFKSGCAVFRDRKGHTLVKNGSQITKRVFVVYKGRQVTGKLVVRDAEFVVHPVADRVRLAGMPDLENWKIAVFEMPKVDAESVTWRFSGEFGDTELKLYQILKADWVSTLELRIEGEDCEVIVGDRAYYEKPQGVWEVSADGATDEGSYLQLNGEPNGQMLMVTERAERRSHRQKLFFLPPDWESRARKPELSRQIEYAEKGQCARVFACENGKEVTILAPLQFPLWYWKDGNGKIAQEPLNIDESNGRALWLESGGKIETARLKISGDVSAEIDVSCWNGSLRITRDILEKMDADTLFRNVCISYHGELLCHGRNVPTDICITPNGRLYVPYNKRERRCIVVCHELYYLLLTTQACGEYRKEINLTSLTWDGNNTACINLGDSTWPSGYIVAEIENCKKEIIWKRPGQTRMPRLCERCPEINPLALSLLEWLPEGNLKNELRESRACENRNRLTQNISIAQFHDIVCMRVPWLDSQLNFARQKIENKFPIYVMSDGYFRLSEESICKRARCGLAGFMCLFGQTGSRQKDDVKSSKCNGDLGIQLMLDLKALLNILNSMMQFYAIELDVNVHEDIQKDAKSTIGKWLLPNFDSFFAQLTPSEITLLAFASSWLECEKDSKKIALNPSFKRILETPKALECAAHIYIIFKALTLLQK